MVVFSSLALSIGIEEVCFRDGGKNMPKKILIVDDEPDVLKVVVFRLKKMGFEIITGTDGGQGLELARAQKPDMIFLDFRMPVMDGAQVCALIKKDETLKKIPVVLITASCENLEQRVAECGADTYVLKPFNLEDLDQAVRKFLSSPV